MNNKFRTLIVTGAAVGITGLGVIGLGVTAAQAQLEEDSFVSTLSEKLGVPEETLESALSDTREEHRAEMEAEMEAKVSESIDNGDLTERQGEIISALQDIREARHEEMANLTDEERDALHEEKQANFESQKDLSEEEREAARAQFEEERQADILQSLVDSGLDVSADELEELRDVMAELGLGHGKGPGSGQKGKGGPGGKGGFGGPKF